MRNLLFSAAYAARNALPLPLLSLYYRVNNAIRGSPDSNGAGMPCEFSETPARPAGRGDVRIAERVLKAYSLSRWQADRRPKDNWTLVGGLYQKGYLALLDRGDPEELARYLNVMFTNEAAFGVAQSAEEYRHLLVDPAYRRWFARHTLDILSRAARSMGGVPKRDADSLAASMSGRAGFDISPPAKDYGMFKLRTSSGAFNGRDVFSIYTMWWLLSRKAVRRTEPVCEIGGGYGPLCYYASKAGVSDYTIIDLPYQNVMQGFYLMRSLPGRRFCLYGEKPRRDAIKILPPESFTEDAGYGAVINQDSFPEISEPVVLGYLRTIRRNSRRFVSINKRGVSATREGHPFVDVPSAVRKCGGFRRTHHSAFAARGGYFTDIYVTGA